MTALVSPWDYVKWTRSFGSFMRPMWVKQTSPQVDFICLHSPTYSILYVPSRYIWGSLWRGWPFIYTDIECVDVAKTLSERIRVLWVNVSSFINQMMHFICSFWAEWLSLYAFFPPDNVCACQCNSTYTEIPNLSWAYNDKDVVLSWFFWFSVVCSQL